MKYISLLLFILTLAKTPLLADQKPWGIIEKSKKASQSLNYKGIYISQNGPELKSVEITHALHGSEQFTRINLLDGQADEVLSHGKNVVIYHRQDNNVVIQKREQHHLFPAIFSGDISEIKKYYLLSFGASQRVAGRMTQIVNLTPKDSLRYAYSFWLDQETSLPLKMIISNIEKKILEQSTFNKIQFNTVTNLDWFTPTLDPLDKYLIEDSITKEINLNRFWRANNIPPGFKEVNFMVSKMAGINLVGNHSVYSDGLSYISLFVQPVRKGQKPQVGDLSFNATNVSARYYKGYQIMAVGSVPLKAVRNLIDSVEF
jgi:sigma-E factor negative regulatory protein RseB